MIECSFYSLTYKNIYKSYYILGTKKSSLYKKYLPMVQTTLIIRMKTKI